MFARATRKSLHLSSRVYYCLPIHLVLPVPGPELGWDSFLRTGGGGVLLGGAWLPGVSVTGTAVCWRIAQGQASGSGSPPTVT
jgi:hypothetical protein